MKLDLAFIAKIETPHRGVSYSQSNKLKENAQEEGYGGNMG